MKINFKIMLRTTLLLAAGAGGTAFNFAKESLVANSALAKARASITSSDLHKQLETMADDALEGRAAGSRGGRAASSYLMQQLEQYGYEPGNAKRFDQPFNGAMRNIIAVLPGSDPELKHEYVLIGAHYDHVGYGNSTNSNGPIGYIHNGADDNGSGVSCLLEIAQALKELPQAPRRSLIIAFWDGEEINLLGSKHWLAHPTIPLTKLKAAVNIDMIGRLRDEQIEFYGSRTAAGWRQLATECNQDAQLKLNFTWELKADSDHHPFFASKIPVAMVHTGLHDDYHRPSDDIQKVNFNGLDRITKYLFDLTIGLTDAQEFPVGKFRTASETETPAQRTQLEKGLPPLPGRLGVRWSDATLPNGGLQITDVQIGSAAAKAGLKRDDVLLKFDGNNLSESDAFRALVWTAPKEAEIEWQRTGEANSRQAKVQLSGEPVRWGFSWRNDDAAPTMMLVNRIVTGTAAAQAGLQVGDRIVEINAQTFRNSGEFERLLNEPTKLEVVVEREGCKSLHTLNGRNPETQE